MLITSINAFIGGICHPKVTALVSHHFGNGTRSVWIGKNGSVLTQVHFKIIKMYVMKLQLQPVDSLKPRVKKLYVKGIYLNCHSTGLCFSVPGISLSS